VTTPRGVRPGKHLEGFLVGRSPAAEHGGRASPPRSGEGASVLLHRGPANSGLLATGPRSTRLPKVAAPVGCSTTATCERPTVRTQDQSGAGGTRTGVIRSGRSLYFAAVRPRLSGDSARHGCRSRHIPQCCETPPMEITSGGTGGPTLAAAFQDRDNNAHGSLSGDPSPETLAHAPSVRGGGCGDLPGQSSRSNTSGRASNCSSTSAR